MSTSNENVTVNACGLAAHKQKEDISFGFPGERFGFTPELADKFAEERGVRVRPNETIDEIDDRGVFVRQANSFIEPFGDKEGQFKAEANRYKIYWAHGCHWSNRPVIVRDILGLTDVIDDIATSGTGKYGHGFVDQKDFKDPSTGAYFLSEFYENAKPGFAGRATTPTLVDVIEKKAVNNDYHRLTNHIEVWFRKYQKTDIDLYPKAYRKEIDEFNDWLFPTINNGHYRMHFCLSWVAYDEAYNDFFDALEKIDEIKYFLHKQQIEVIDYSENTRQYFDLMPGTAAGTIRPALIADGALLKKGLASTGK